MGLRKNIRFWILTIVIGISAFVSGCTTQTPTISTNLATEVLNGKTTAVLNPPGQKDFGGEYTTKTSPPTNITENISTKSLTPTTSVVLVSTPFPTETAKNDIALNTNPTPLKPTPTLSPNAWMNMPVIPVISENAREIYQRGLRMGNNPHAFSKVGDCQNVPSLFLAVFDLPPRYYRLGEYEYLRETIDWFSGSFGRESLAVKGGYNAAALLNPLLANKEACLKNETPLACELRIHRPSIVIVSLETWWSKKPAETYEAYMRPVIEYIISQGAVPILVTKADNLEGDHSINATIVKLAWEYDIPLWNFWRAVQPLPDKGLTEDGFHLTYANNYFDSKWRMKNGWPVRNLTALQALDAVWQGVNEEQSEQP
jgi:hypothetical protein